MMVLLSYEKMGRRFLGLNGNQIFSYHSSFGTFVSEQMCGMLSILLYQLLLNGDEMSLQCTFIGNSETQLVTGVRRRGMDNFLQLRIQLKLNTALLSTVRSFVRVSQA